MARLIGSVVLALTLFAAPVLGQTTFSETLAPALSHDEYQLIASKLSLTPEQRAATDALYEGYLAEHRRHAGAFRQAWKDHSAATWVNGQRVDDEKADKSLLESVAGYARQKPGAQRKFLTDLRVVLEEAQVAAHWESVERMIRRKWMDTLLWRSPVEWHRVDLVRGVLSLDLPEVESGKVRSLLEEYEFLIDKPLRRIDIVAGKPAEESRPVWMEGALDLRSHNRRYLRLIAESLAPEHAARLRAWAKDRAYWTLSKWKETSTHKGAADAKTLGTLTDEQAARIVSLLSEIDKAVVELRAQAVAAYDLADERLMQMNDRDYLNAMEQPDNPLLRATAEWSMKYDELYTGSEARLEAILTAEQRKQLWPNGSLRDAMIARSRKFWE